MTKKAYGFTVETLNVGSRVFVTVDWQLPASYNTMHCYPGEVFMEFDLSYSQRKKYRGSIDKELIEKL